MNLTMILSKKEYIQDCWDKARDYCEGVQEGRIICNENIRLAVKRHEEDVLRYDLDWRPDEVERVFNFAYYIYLDKGERLNLQPFQCFIILALFGLYFKDTNIRKYLYAFLFIGRKNGKTTFVCFLQLYFLLADGVTFPQSVLVAGSQNQSNDTAFKELRQIVMSSPALNQRLEVRQSNKIVFKDKRKYGYTKTVPAITDRLEGLNPTSCILDEIHTYKDAQKFNVIKNALGTKLNPMLFLISTAGFGMDSFCAQLVETGRNVLRGISTDDRFFYLLYELEEGDDIENETNWYKANPGLDTILDLRLFKDQFNTNKSIPSLFNDFVTKRFNIFLQENSQWIPTDILLPCFTTFNEEDIKNLPCYIGLDLSATRDLTSIVLLFEGDGKFYVKPYFYFVKGDNNSLRKGNIDILQWIREGYIIECNTPTIDYELVKQTLLEINNIYNVKGLYYDPWHFDRLLNDMKQAGIWCVAVPPFAKHFDPAMRFVETCFYEKIINIQYNKCMMWNFRNIVLYKDLNGNMRPNKNKSADAIDGVISLLNSISGYIKSNTNYIERFIKNS